MFITGFPIKVEQFNDGQRWVTLEEITWADADGKIVTVPRWFVTDFASVPRVCWTIFPKSGTHNAAAIVHDFGCRVQRESRDVVNSRFLTILEWLDDNGWSNNRLKRKLFYRGVQLFGPRWDVQNEHK